MTRPYRDMTSEHGKVGSKFFHRMKPLDFIDHPYINSSQEYKYTFISLSSAEF